MPEKLIPRSEIQPIFLKNMIQLYTPNSPNTPMTDTYSPDQKIKELNKRISLIKWDLQNISSKEIILKKQRELEEYSSELSQLIKKKDFVN